jgi:hypothetical protein
MSIEWNSRAADCARDRLLSHVTPVISDRFHESVTDFVNQADLDHSAYFNYALWSNHDHLE